jgi:cyanophycinase
MKPRPLPSRGATSTGSLLAIGGAEDKLRQREILARFTALAGGSDARVVIISTASSLGDVTADRYRAIFASLGMTDTEGMRPLNREEAQDPRLAARVAEATGIFLTGGNQLRLASVVAGTRLGAALVEQHQRGAVIAGTSAGASALSSHMIAFGRSGPSPKQRMAQLGAGLGLLPDVLIDQHFTERNRIGRLEALVAHSPSLLALGIDEDTAALIGPDRVLEVIGKGSVTILDGSNLVTDAHEVPRHRPLMVSGVLLHVLTSGYRFDLRSRRLLGPLQSLVEREASE